MHEARMYVFSQQPDLVEVGRGSYLPVPVNQTDLIRFLEYVIIGADFVLKNWSTHWTIQKQRILEINVCVNGLHVKFASPIQQKFRRVVASAVLTSHDGQPGSPLHLLLGQLPRYRQFIMQMQVLYHWALWQMIMYWYINPFFAALPSLLLRPLSLDLTSLPAENQQNAWHLKFERIVFFYLHSQNFGVTWKNAEF